MRRRSDKSGPDRLYVEKEYLKDFRLLNDEADSPFYKKRNQDVFLMAMFVGIRYGSNPPIKKREELVRVEYLTDDDLSVLKAVAISEMKDPLVLLDLNKVFQIAEEYASGGIGYLKDAVFKKGFGSYEKRLETDLIESFEKNYSNHK